MEGTWMPSAEHAEFDRLCDPLEEFEPLPEHLPAAEDDWDEFDESQLDEQILRGLVIPVG